MLMGVLQISNETRKQLDLENDHYDQCQIKNGNDAVPLCPLSPARNKLEEMNTSQPEVNLPTSLGNSTTVTVPSTPLTPFNVAPNLN